MKVGHAWVPAVALLLAINASADWADPFTAKYGVTLNGFSVGEMERSLQSIGDNRFLFKTKSLTKGLASFLTRDEVVETSVWSMEDGEPIPQSYLLKQTGRWGSETRSADFDWEAGVVNTRRDERQATLSLMETPHMVDKILYQLLLKRDLAAGLTRFDYTAAGVTVSHDYHFRVIGNETIETALGLLETVKVERIDPSNEQKSYFWCAPKLDYLLVRAEVHTKHKILRSDIERLGP